MAWKKLSKKAMVQPPTSITIKKTNGLGNPWTMGIGKEIAEKLDYSISVFVDHGKIGLAKDLTGYKMNRTCRWIMRDFGFDEGTYPLEWDENDQMFVGNITERGRK